MDKLNNQHSKNDVRDNETLLNKKVCDTPIILTNRNKDSGSITLKKDGLKALIPQIYATYLTGTTNMFYGMVYTYAAVIIPQIEAPDSTLNVTSSESTLIVASASFTIAVTQLFSGLFPDKFGKINSLKVFALPNVLGWLLIAVATNANMIIIGRFLCGFGVGLISNPSIAYITEIAKPHIRGVLLVCIPIYVSLGIIISYLQGYLLHWKTIALINFIITLIPSILMWFLPESPIWLVSKGRVLEAEKSLNYFNKYYLQSAEKTKSELKQLLNYNESNMSVGGGFKEFIGSFIKPTTYRPLFILIGIFFFQQFSGIYVILLLATIFFEKIGNNINEYLASIFVGLSRLIVSIVAMWAMGKYNRRTLMIFSAAFMAVFMFTSGIFTYWIQEGKSTLEWVPLVCIMLYVTFSTIGMAPIPWFLSSELFPTITRSTGQGITTFIGTVMMSVHLQYYRDLEKFLGGSYAIQLFYSCICFLCIIYVWFFMPETHNKKLSEIEEYFTKNLIFKKKNEDITETV